MSVPDWFYATCRGKRNKYRKCSNVEAAMNVDNGDLQYFSEMSDITETTIDGEDTFRPTWFYATHKLTSERSLYRPFDDHLAYDVVDNETWHKEYLTDITPVTKIIIHTEDENGLNEIRL